MGRMRARIPCGIRFTEFCALGSNMSLSGVIRNPGKYTNDYDTPVPAYASKIHGLFDMLSQNARRCKIGTEKHSQREKTSSSQIQEKLAANFEQVQGLRYQ